MKIIALADIHGVRTISESFRNEAEGADYILIAGDITHFGGGKEAEQTLKGLLSLNIKTLAVTGNCDETGVGKYLLKEGISLEKRVEFAAEYHLYGIGGSLPAPVYTPNTYSEDTLKEILLKAGKSLPPEKTIILSHQPPWKTKLDKAAGRFHVGSRVLRTFIEKTKPDLVVCGHIHESAGIDNIGRTFLINPGPFRNGMFGVIQTSPAGVQLRLCR